MIKDSIGVTLAEFYAEVERRRIAQQLAAVPEAVDAAERERTENGVFSPRAHDEPTVSAPPPATTKRLRAITRAPDVVQDAYREGRIGQTLTALIRESLQATRTSCNGAIDHIIGERKTAQELARKAVPLLPAHAEKGAASPNPNGRAGNRVDMVNPVLKGGNAADYLSRRIARDAPEVLERMKAGEFPSVRAAAVEAPAARESRGDAVRHIGQSMSEAVEHIIAECESAQELALRAVPGVPFWASGFLLVHVIRMLHIGVQMADERNEQVSLRMTAHEVSMLKALAALDGISQSGVLRMLMRRDWLNRFGDKMPPKVKR